MEARRFSLIDLEHHSELDEKQDLRSTFIAAVADVAPEFAAKLSGPPFYALAKHAVSTFDADPRAFTPPPRLLREVEAWARRLGVRCPAREGEPGWFALAVSHSLVRAVKVGLVRDGDSYHASSWMNGAYAVPGYEEDLQRVTDAWVHAPPFRLTINVEVAKPLPTTRRDLIRARLLHTRYDSDDPPRGFEPLAHTQRELRGSLRDAARRAFNRQIGPAVTKYLAGMPQRPKRKLRNSGGSTPGDRIHWLAEVLTGSSSEECIASEHDVKLAAVREAFDQLCDILPLVMIVRPTPSRKQRLGAR